MPATKQLKKFQWAADVKVSKIADNATIAPVTLTARSGDVIDHYYWGPIVHDLSGMIMPAGKLPLDYEHGTEIGYLDQFDTSGGDLVCEGAIVPVANDISSVVVQKMAGGVPYQASIEFDDDDQLLLEFIPEGFTAIVNGRQIIGPVTVVRQWTLIAVAICKLGADDDTCAELAFAKKNNNSGLNKGFFVKVTKNKAGDVLMSKQNEGSGEAQKPGDTKPIEVKPAEVKPAENKPVETTLSQAKPVASEAKPEAAASSAPVTPTLPGAPLAKPADDRVEFKRYVTEFGKEKAAEYFSEGLDFGAAVAKHMAFQRDEITALKNKLSAADRGEAAPVKFSKTGEAKGMAAVISKAK